MSNLLLITDVARLRKIFGRLAEDKSIRLRVVNNLENGGEELAIEKPDVVFVQTHLSGLSADILLMHLKKQLGRKRSKFILLAAPGQANDTIRKSFQGWLDTSVDDNQMLADLYQLLDTLQNRPKRSPDTPSEPEPSPTAPENDPPRDSAPPSLANVFESPLEEQGITYGPRKRLQVYSEFNSSFDNAVSNTPEPEALEPSISASPRQWGSKEIVEKDSGSSPSRTGTVLIWLSVVVMVIAVAVVTYMQHQPVPEVKAPVTKPFPIVTAKPILRSFSSLSSARKPAPPVAIPLPPTPTPPPPAPRPATPAPRPATPAPRQVKVRDTEKEVLSAVVEKQGVKKHSPPAAAKVRPTVLPPFIPRYSRDKKYSAANPGWERYNGKIREFKVLYEKDTIKAIQIIDRRGQGISDSFLRYALQQVTPKPSFVLESSEKKEGYEIQRGHIASGIKATYYRDETTGRLQALALTWQ